MEDREPDPEGEPPAPAANGLQDSRGLMEKQEEPREKATLRQTPKTRRPRGSPISADHQIVNAQGDAQGARLGKAALEAMQHGGQELPRGAGEGHQVRVVQTQRRDCPRGQKQKYPEHKKPRATKIHCLQCPVFKLLDMQRNRKCRPMIRRKGSQHKLIPSGPKYWI